MSKRLKGLNLLTELSRDDKCVLQESDYKLGWSLNTRSWYKQDYYRHLTTDFCQRVGTVEDVNLVKEKYKLSLSLILSKFRRHLAREDFLIFNLGANLDDYILPSLNLISKVRKLTEKAGVVMEPLLTGVLIITRYDRCVGRRSLVLRPKSMMGYVKSRCCKE